MINRKTYTYTNNYKANNCDFQLLLYIVMNILSRFDGDVLNTKYNIRPIKKETLNSVQKFEVSKPK